MTNKKITGLTSATTPLAGTEVLPIVQSGATVKATIANVVGAGTSPGSFTSLAISSNLTQTGNGWIGASSGASYTADDGVFGGKITNGGGFLITTGGVERFRINATSGGDVLIQTGNLAPSTAAKGINFTANTPAAGMTSQLLNWYEEGTWAPNQGSGLTVVGAFSSSGTYTRIGRQVFIRGSVSGATSVAVASAGAISTNLPYSAAADATGAAINAANSASSILRVSSATLTAATAIAATATMTFSAVYAV